MSRLSPVLTFGLLLAAPVAWAQSAADPAVNPTSAVPPAMAKPGARASVAPDPASEATPPAPHVVSATTSAMLSATQPKYTPPPVQAAPKPEEEVDLRLIDKPRNKIVRLPRMMVRDRPPPVFTARSFQNSNDVTNLGFKKYSGLRLGPFSSLNAPIAKAMYQEDERLDDFSDLKGSAMAISRGGDTAEGEYLNKQVQGTFMHDVWGSGDPGAYSDSRHWDR